MKSIAFTKGEWNMEHGAGLIKCGRRQLSVSGQRGGMEQMAGAHARGGVGVGGIKGRAG